MKVKTSITLPDDLIAQIDEASKNRSEFLEKAARQFLYQAAKAEREARDLAIINANLDRLNEQALEGVEYQEFDWD